MADLSFTVDQQSLRRLFAQLDHATATATLEPPMQRSLARMQHDLQVYPSPAKRPQPFKSDKQRKFVFAMIKEGKIPYKRTGNLGRAWTAHVTAQSGGLEGTLGNNTSYAPLVQGQGRQAAAHQGVWNTDSQVFERHRSAIERDFQSTIEKALAGR